MGPRNSLLGLAVLGGALSFADTISSQEPLASVDNGISMARTESAHLYRRFLDDLRHPDPSARSVARDVLQKLLRTPDGNDDLVREILRLREDDDAEVAMLASELSRSPMVESMFQPTMVRCDMQDVSVCAALGMIERQTGNRLSAGLHGCECNDVRITLFHDEPVPFWEALRQIAQQSGNQIRLNAYNRFSPTGLVAGDYGKCPEVGTGPVRARITNAIRTFVDRVDFEKDTVETYDSYKLDVEMLWEDNLRVVACAPKPNVVSAVNADGSAVTFSPIGPRCSSLNVVSSGVRHHHSSINVTPPNMQYDSWKKLRLEWEVIAVGEMETIEITDFTPGKTYTRDDVKVTVLGVEPLSYEGHHVQALVQRVDGVPEPKEILLHENEFSLIDQYGVPFERQHGSDSFCAGENCEEVVKVRGNYRQPSKDSVPVRLQVRYPRLRAKKFLPLEFHDVPLSRRRPE